MSRMCLVNQLNRMSILKCFKVSSVSGGQLTPTSALYKTYEDALAAYNASSSIKAIQKDDKIIKIKVGKAFGSKNPNNTTTLYKDSSFKTQVTYIQAGREMKYIGSSPEHVLLELGGLTYYAKQNEVDLVPTDLVSGSDYYKVGSDGVLYHYPYNNLDKSQPNIQLVPLPRQCEMEPNIQVLTAFILTKWELKNRLRYYPYFQFQSVRHSFYPIPERN